MNILKNYLYFFKLSLISLILSIIVLNIALVFYETKKALIITLVVVFIVNFIKLKNHYKFNNNYIFFIYSIFTRIISRIVEYFLFLLILDILNSHNISWIITISFTHFLKFFFVEIFRKYTKKN
jgi:hypothetical protein